MENPYPNCINCSANFDSDTFKCNKINIAVPVEGEAPDNKLVQSIQILELSLREILHDIYGLLFLEAEQLSICSTCSSNLASLFLAHKNLANQRHETSILALALAKVKEILTEQQQVLLLKGVEEALGTHDDDDDDDGEAQDIFEIESVRETNNIELGVEENIGVVTIETSGVEQEIEDAEPSSVLQGAIAGNILISIGQPAEAKQLLRNPKILPNQVLILTPEVMTDEPTTPLKLIIPGATPPINFPEVRPGVSVSIFDNKPTNIPNTITVPKGPPYTCSQCSKLLHTARSYRNHMEKHREQTQTLAFTCSSCVAHFETSELLQQHKLLVHASDSGINSLAAAESKSRSVTLTVKLEPGLCQYPGCGSLSGSKEEAVEHYISLHSRCESDIYRARSTGFGQIQFEFKAGKNGQDSVSGANVFYSQSQIISDPPPKDGSDTFTVAFPNQTFQFTVPDGHCPYCNKNIQSSSSGNWSRLKGHIRDVHLYFLQNRSYSCPKCPLVFNRRSLAKVHRRKCGQPKKSRKGPRRRENNGLSYSCGKCGKFFSTPGFLQSHVSTGKCGRVFPCEICGLTFGKNAGLVSHMISHTTERPFFCDRCGRNYKSKHALTFHQKISHSEQGRLEYNQMTRLKNRKRKLAEKERAANQK